jgi:hypothetical protein
MHRKLSVEFDYAYQSRQGRGTCRGHLNGVVDKLFPVLLLLDPYKRPIVCGNAAEYWCCLLISEGRRRQIGWGMSAGWCEAAEREMARWIGA